MTMEHNYSKDMRRAMTGASAVQDELAKIAEATAALESQLPQAYAQLRQARQELGAASADEAMGLESGVDAARQRFTRANETLATLASGILSLQNRRDSQEAGLLAASVAIEPLLPEFDKKAIQAFVPKWNAAAAVWSKVLGERQALQTALGRPLDLTEPAPSNVELDPQLSAPRQLLRQLQQALGTIRSARVMQQRSAGKTPLTFDETAIYVFVRDVNINSRTYRANEQVLGRLLGQAAFKYLSDTRALKRADHEPMAAAG
jgi:hypothetical protein